MIYFRAQARVAWVQPEVLSRGVRRYVPNSGMEVEKERKGWGEHGKEDGRGDKEKEGRK